MRAFIAIALKYWPQIVGGLILAALLAWGSHARYTAGYDKAEAKYQKVLAQYAKAEAEAVGKARKAEQALAQGIAAADAQNQQELSDAKAANARLLAGLRAGTIRLRSEWEGCAPDRLPGTAANPRQPNDAAERRISGAGRAIEAVDDDAAKIRALQAIIKAERK